MEKKEIAQLFQAYPEDVFRLALSYLHNRQDAEDICQSVFLKLIGYQKPIQTGKEKQWLLTCAANACRDHLRSFHRKNTVELEEAMALTCPMDKTLWEAVCSLAPKYRAVVHLYYYEGYSQEEIAGILKISRTAVQTRVSRAKRQLKEVLSQYEE